jgi:S1-C subfamily serine protease
MLRTVITMRNARGLLRFWLYLTVVTLFMAASCCLVPASAQTTDWATLIQAAKPAVVYIETDKGRGSGTIISPDGYILTAAHVISGANRITVWVEESRQYSAMVAAADYTMDVAALKIPASGLTWLALGDSDKVVYDQDVRALGYPWQGAGRGFVASAATIHGFRTRDTIDLIQFTAVINPGNSGGTLIGESGEIIGVVSELWSQAQFPEAPPTPFALAVCINTARQIIPYGALPSGPSPVQPIGGTESTASIIRVPQDQPTIVAAVRSAAEGAEIQVARGTYAGDLSITRPLTISGSDGVVVKGTLRVSAARNVIVTGLTVQGSVELRDSTSFTLDHVTVSGSATDGITINASSGVIAGCVVEQSTETGIVVLFGSSVSISSSSVQRCARLGLSILFNSQARLARVTVTGNGSDGVSIEASSAEITGTEISQNGGWGISASPDAIVTGRGNLGWANARGAASGPVTEDTAPAIRVPVSMSLGDALRTVPEGSRGSLILVSPGTYSLASVTWPSASVVMRGVGDDSGEVELMDASRTSSLYVGGEYSASIENLTVTGADLRAGEGAQLQLTDCVLRGGETGLNVYGEAVAVLENCRISDCRGDGLAAMGSAAVELVACEVVSNMRRGVHVQGEASVTAVDCTITGNGRCPLPGEPCDYAELFGICAEGTSHLDLLRCTVSQSGGVGVYASDSAMVQIEATTVKNSGADESAYSGIGIQIRDSAGGRIQGGIVIDNQGDGIEKHGETSLVLDGVTVSGNKGTALEVYSGGYRDQRRMSCSVSSCALTGNTCGLDVSGATDVTVEDSEISGNAEDGLDIHYYKFYDAPIVRVTRCVVSDNGGSGIAVLDGEPTGSEDGAVELAGTDILNNAAFGIFVDAPMQHLVHVSEMRLGGNGADLGGFASPALRPRLAQASTKERVTVPGDYDTLQAAVDAVVAGGTVAIERGESIGNVTIWKPLTIEGQDAATTSIRSQSGRKTVLSILAGVSLVRLVNLAIGQSDGDGITAYCDQIEMSGCDVANNGADGLFIASPVTRVVLDTCDFTRNESSGVRFTYASLDKIQIDGQANKMRENGFPFYEVGWGAQLEDLLLRLTIPLVAETSKPVLRVPEDYETVQEALDAAPSGGRIQLGQGTYRGGLVVRKSVTIEGASALRTQLAGTRSAPATIYVGAEAQEVMLSGFRITGGTGSYCVVLRSNTVDLTHLDIDGGGYCAMSVGGATQVRIQDCEIAAEEVGIELLDVASASVESCRVSGPQFIGITIEDSAEATLEDCDVVGPESIGVCGVSAKGTTVSLEDCRIRNWDIGVELVAGSGRVASCTVENAYIGVILAGASTLMLAQTTMSDSEFGIVANTESCWLDNWPRFSGSVEGSDNTFVGDPAGAAFPVYPGPPWPDGLFAQQSP